MAKSERGAVYTMLILGTGCGIAALGFVLSGHIAFGCYGFFASGGAFGAGLTGRAALIHYKEWY